MFENHVYRVKISLLRDLFISIFVHSLCQVPTQGLLTKNMDHQEKVVKHLEITNCK